VPSKITEGEEVSFAWERSQPTHPTCAGATGPACHRCRATLTT